MIRAFLIVGLTLAPGLLSPAVAQDAVWTDTRYTPAPLWYAAPGHIFGSASGRMRIVTGGGVSAALDLDQFWTYENVYREALGRLAMRMPVRQADPFARKEALDAVFARYPERQIAAFPVTPIERPAALRSGG